MKKARSIEINKMLDEEIAIAEHRINTKREKESFIKRKIIGKRVINKCDFSEGFISGMNYSMKLQGMPPMSEEKE